MIVLLFTLILRWPLLPDTFFYLIQFVIDHCSLINKEALVHTTDNCVHSFLQNGLFVLSCRPVEIAESKRCGFQHSAFIWAVDEMCGGSPWPPRDLLWSSCCLFKSIQCFKYKPSCCEASFACYLHQISLSSTFLRSDGLWKIKRYMSSHFTPWTADASAFIYISLVSLLVFSPVSPLQLIKVTGMWLPCDVEQGPKHCWNDFNQSFTDGKSLNAVNKQTNKHVDVWIKGQTWR